MNTHRVFSYISVLFSEQPCNISELGIIIISSHFINHKMRQEETKYCAQITQQASPVHSPSDSRFCVLKGHYKIVCVCKSETEGQRDKERKVGREREEGRKEGGRDGRKDGRRKGGRKE